MNRILAVFLSICLILCLCPMPTLAETAETPDEAAGSGAGSFRYRYADAAEGAALMLGNTEYYAGFTQNDLDFKMQKKGASMEEYQAFAAEQVRDFTEEEKACLDACLADIETILAEKHLILPPMEEVVFIVTTMAEENGAGAYTHGTQIYLMQDLLDAALLEPDECMPYLEENLCHELFHCLTRCNPDFRAEMYRIISFTVQEEDFPIPPSVREFFISNPDVEHHNSYAAFRINGELKDCFMALVTTRHFEQEGESFFDCCIPALVPIDGTNVWYTPEQAENFDELLGTNTDYVIDPEECMADNFSYAVLYGMEGPEGTGYPNPEIIEAVINSLGGK